MKHLELAREYFNNFGKPLIEQGFPEIADRYAAGLVGQGSGCFGFDDEYSKDHDFAPGFCIWLTDEDYDLYGAKLQEAYDFLPVEFKGYSKNNIVDDTRMGVMKISDFYGSFTGCTDVPETNFDWFLISENNLVTATNGEVFVDKLGEFTRIREGLKKGYPKDVLYKKLAARACTISQAGQYNYQRCLKRGDKLTASLAAARFAEATMSMLYLLFGGAAPFYKWMYKGLEFAGGNEDVEKLLTSLKALLVHAPGAEGMIHIEAVTSHLIKIMTEKLELEFAGYFLQDYAGQLMARIEDPELKIMHPMADCI